MEGKRERKTLAWGGTATTHSHKHTHTDPRSYISNTLHRCNGFHTKIIPNHKPNSHRNLFTLLDLKQKSCMSLSNGEKTLQMS